MGREYLLCRKGWRWPPKRRLNRRLRSGLRWQCPRLARGCRRRRNLLRAIARIRRRVCPQLERVRRRRALWRPGRQQQRWGCATLWQPTACQSAFEAPHVVAGDLQAPEEPALGTLRKGHFPGLRALGTTLPCAKWYTASMNRGQQRALQSSCSDRAHRLHESFVLRSKVCGHFDLLILERRPWRGTMHYRHEFGRCV